MSKFRFRTGFAICVRIHKGPCMLALCHTPDPLKTGTRVKRSTDLTPTKVLNPPPPYSQKLYKMPFALLQKGSPHASPVWIKRFKRAEVWLMPLAPISLQEWSLIIKSCIGSSCLTSAKASSARLAETSSHPNPRRQNISSSRSTSTGTLTYQKCGSVTSLAHTPFLFSISCRWMMCVRDSLAWRFLLVRSYLVKYYSW